MNIAIIGRTEILLDTAEKLHDAGHKIPLVITAKEALEYKATRNDYKNFAHKIDAEYISTASISSDEVKQLFTKIASLDLGVSMNYSGIIPQNIIEYFSIGILNAHGGDLPKYRGNACQAWAILNGEDYIGLCIHKMIGGELDSGDIIARSYFPIDINTKITAFNNWWEDEIPKLFAYAVNELNDDPEFILEKQSKDAADVLRCYPRKPEDGRIDWNTSNTDILRLVNASNKPYSGAFCEFEGDKMTLWDAEIAPDENFVAVPGQVTKIGNGFVEVATGEGKLTVNRIEYKDSVQTPDKIFSSIRQRLK